ncbi:Outer membrane protein oprM precursor [Delftia tsuruhatensis]|uniref:efflux transporter outer membrane subunit n=1 Tax=Delftia tsuruhatensis TaxID=180282 RepID=UPI001E79E918|nr:efflux transporter outer membrane subunit [Delftia tsuruhatensis]CAB5714408.1 Outer membrane protein oprM precursor [Delftia tsuruhatensis]CAC9689044.1 Outer membrane protein oprM precursor [Delftia tsuruhatensis]
MQLLKTSVLACAAALAGCGALTRTPYEAPAVALPAQFEHAQPATAQPMADPMTAPWWHRFGDPRLDAWIALALERNPDLATAGIRVRRAALQAQLAGRALLPQPSGTLGTGASRPLSGSPRSTLETSSASLSVAWELDLFDRLGAQRDAARFEAEASAQDLQAVRLTLTTTAAGLYWQLAQANERLDSTGQSLAYARRTLELVQAQYRSGAVSSLELREARQSLAQQEALQSQYLQARAELRQSLAELLAGAQPPGGEPQALPTLALPAVQAGLPAELLGRRPDLRAAELRLRAALASSDAAAARYYPTLSLTGSLGGSSNALLDLLANPVAALGANMTLPFLNVGEMRLNTAIARNQYEEAVVSFRKSLYAALSETEKALSARTRLQEQEGAQQRALQEALEITRLYEARYRAGQVPLRSWLDAQERQRTAQLALSALHLEQLQNQLTLYKVLGGGLTAPG